MTIRRGAVAVVLVLAAVGACGRRDPGVPPAVGTVEVIEVDVAPLVGARVTRIWKDEGAAVRAGDTLVSLTLSTMQPDLDARRARLAQAEAVLRDLEAGARPAEIERAAAELRVAEAEALRAEDEVTRLTPLAANGTVSEQSFTAASAAAREADAHRDALREALLLVREGTRPERIRAARADVENARAALAAVEGAASDLVLTAPVAGVVLARHAEPGEILRAGEAALTLGDMAHPWVRIFVDQQALPLIRVGDPARAVLDAFPRLEFFGRVTAIRDKAEFTPRVALTEDERADLLFGVKIELRDSLGMLKPGLPVTVRVLGSGPRTGAGSGDRPAAVPIPPRP